MLAAKAHLSPADYKRREGVHWNEKGHRKMARIVESLYDAFKTGTLGQFVHGDVIGSGAGKYRAARETLTSAFCIVTLPLGALSPLQSSMLMSVS